MPIENVDKPQVTVAELIAVLSKMPQDAKVWVEGDYGFHHCDGAHLDDADGTVILEIG